MSDKKNRPRKRKRKKQRTNQRGPKWGIRCRFHNDCRPLWELDTFVVGGEMQMKFAFNYPGSGEAKRDETAERKADRQHQQHEHEHEHELELQPRLARLLRNILLH